MSSHRIHFRDEQLWQAFRYVAAELSVTDAEAFEQQMLQDAALCEAVAAATMLLSNVAASGRQSRTMPPSSATLSRPPGFAGRFRTVAVTAATCCCLALVLLLSRFPDTSTETIGLVAQAAATDAELLVAAWAEDFELQADEESEYDDSVQQELAVPDWMLAAMTPLDLDALERSDMPLDELMPDDMEFF
jgi:anti-sigma-K factor RskA